MADRPASLDAIERAARVMRETRVPYAFIGGVAMGAWAVPRPTFDADLILLKLVADRPKDRLDVENVLAVQGIPEREYMERWATTLGVRDRLDEVLRRIG